MAPVVRNTPTKSALYERKKSTVELGACNSEKVET